MKEAKPKPRKKRRFREFTKRLLVVGFGLFVGAAIIELTLRMLGISYFLPYEPNAFCGTRLRPGIRGWYRREGVAFVEINNDGNRDEQRSQGKPKSTFRIAVIGDSYAEAMQVNLDETFWKQLETNLNEDERKRIEQVQVLNFGVSGYGTAQELQMLRNYVWSYSPDIVVLAFLTGNDLTDNSKSLGFTQPRPYFELKDGKLVLDDSFKVDPTYLHGKKWTTELKVNLINSSRLLQLVNQAKTAWESRSQSGPRQPGLNELGLDPAVYQAPKTQEWEEAWDVTLEIIRTMNQEAERVNVPLFVLCLSNGVQVHPDPAVRTAFQKEHGIDDLFYPDRRMGDFCEAEGIPHLLLAPKMQATAEKESIYFHGFDNTAMGTGHWNQAGHRFAGEALAEAIAPLVFESHETAEVVEESAEIENDGSETR